MVRFDTEYVFSIWTLIKLIWLYRFLRGKSLATLSRSTIFILLLLGGDFIWNTTTYCQPKDGTWSESFVMDLVPVIGGLKAGQEFIEGCDTVTGEKLGSFRWLALTSAILEVVTLTTLDEVIDVAKLSRIGLDEGSEFFARSADDVLETGAGTIARTADDVFDTVIRRVNPPDPCSFAPDTLVATQYGLIPISDMKVGMMALAYDAERDITSHYPVTAVFVHTDTTIVNLTIAGEVIETTSEHPFYIEGRGFIPAAQLWIDAPVLSANVIGKIDDVEIKNEHRLMYNLAVEEANTFFVGEGHWLVHNTCPFIVSDQIIKDWDGNVVFRGDIDLNPTLHRINNEIPYPHRNDNTIFRNDGNPLPVKPEGYYREYVHPTIGIEGLGPERVIIGAGGEIYYTPDHYKTFIKVN